jgi:general secretion pathway protein C
MSVPANLKDLQDLASHPFVERTLKHLPDIIAGLLVIAIAWQLVQLTWLMVGTQPVNAVAIASAPPAIIAGPKIDPQAIANAHLFGTPSAESSDADASNAPQTQMSLVLAGTIASDDPAKGFAIIGESAAAAKFYSVGAMIGGSARLHAVYADRVILDRNGQLEALMLPRQASSLVAPPKPPPVAANAGGNRFVENLRRVAETNPGALTEVIRPQPVFANGTQRGYRVYPGRNRQQFAKLGLQPGDLVTSINGTPLDDPARGQEIMSALASSDRVTVTVERNGQSQQLTLNTAQLSLPDAGEPTAPLAPQVIKPGTAPTE